MENLIQTARNSWACYRAKRACIKAAGRCQACGSPAMFGRIRLEAHHIQPVQVRPDLAAESENLVCLDAACHFHVGHLGNWNCWNSALPETIVAMRQAWVASQTREMRP